MLLYALGALKLYRPIYGDMIRRVSTYIDQPRLDSYDGASMTVEELLAWGESIKPKAAAAFMGTGEFAPGEWCRFCRAKASAAPAQTKTPRWKILRTVSRWGDPFRCRQSTTPQGLSRPTA